MPDRIVAATALYLNVPVISRDGPFGRSGKEPASADAEHLGVLRPKMRRLWNLPSAEHSENGQKCLTQIGVFLDIALQVFPAQRKHVAEQGAELMVIPIPVRQRVNAR
jgi:hypothetical protein